MLFFLGPLFFVSNPASCNFLPSWSSPASFKKSFSSPRVNSTLAYAPIATFYPPFSNIHKVSRPIPALSQTWSAVSLRRSLPGFIFNPASNRILASLGIRIIVLLFIMFIIANIIFKPLNDIGRMSILFESACPG